MRSEGGIYFPLPTDCCDLRKLISGGDESVLISTLHMPGTGIAIIGAAGRVKVMCRISYADYHTVLMEAV